jgi:hypothetical protein
MASDDEDPYVKAGREIAAGEKPTTAEEADPYVAAGKVIAGASPALPAAATTIDQPDSGLTWRGTAKEIAAAGPRIGANVINLLSDPYANLIGYPLTVAGQTAYDFLAPKLGYNQLTPEQRADLYAPFQGQIGSRAVTAVGQNIPGGPPLDPYNTPGTPAEKLAGRVAEGAGTVGSLGPSGVAPIVAGGAGAAAGDMAARYVDPKFAPAAELVGNMAGATAAGAGTTAARTVRGAVSDVSAADAALGRLAIDKYRIPINAQDLSANSAYRIMADQAGKLPFSGAGPSAAAKQSAWQGAIAKEMGEPGATAFTSDVMDRARTRIGAEFDRVARSTNIDQPSVNTMVGDLATIEHDMHMVLPANELPKLKAQLDNIVDVASKQNGTISGQSYQALTRKGAPLDLAERSADPNVRHVAGQIRDALDDAFVRSATPEDQAALAQAKYQYRVMRTIDPMVAGSRDGNISPDAFMQKVVGASRKFDSPTGGIAYTGGGNIGELAKIGKLMRAPPQTGTADRSIINLLALGGTGAPLLFDPTYAAAIPSTLALNRAVGAYLRSGGQANRVINNALKPPLGSPYPLAGPVMAGEDTRP